MSVSDSGSSAPNRDAVFRWDGASLVSFDSAADNDSAADDSRAGDSPTADDTAEYAVAAADSWLVEDGRVLALDLHRRRFLDAVASTGLAAVSALGAEADAGLLVSAEAFWSAVVAETPGTGAWFPRVELQCRGDSPVLVYRHRAAPARRRSVVLATAPGPDSRTRPGIKGPDLAAMSRLRFAVRPRGAEEAVICSPDGYVIEGAYSAILWWRGDTLCAPSPDLERVDSVTVRSVIALATALGVEVLYESVTPDELDGLEIWVLSALHGIRIATGWVDGPQPAEKPGRLALWRGRLGRLSRPVDTLDR